MNAAVGVDVVDVERFHRRLVRFPRLAERLFTPQERDTCRSTNETERLAARFAAKEAAFKALGAGWPEIPYRDIEIVTAADGHPWLVLHGRAAGLAGHAVRSVSLAHDAGVAMAGVLLAG